MYLLLSSLYKKRSTLIGLAVLANELMLVCVSHQKKVRRLEYCLSMPLSTQVISEGKIIDREQITAILKEWVTKKGIKGYSVAIAIPNQFVISQKIVLSHCHNDKEYEAEIHAQLSHYLPGMKEEICFDYQLQEKDKEGQHVLLVAAKQEVVDSFVDVVNGAGLVVKAVEADWSAMARVMGLSVALNNKMIGILTVDDVVIKFEILHDTYRFYTQHLTLETGSSLEIISDFIKQCVHDYSAALHPVQIDCLVVKGGSSSLTAICDYLRAILNIRVERPDFLSGLFFSEKANKQLCEDAASRSLVPFGLVLRSMPIW